MQPSYIFYLNKSKRSLSNKPVRLHGVMDLQHSLLLDDVATVDNRLDCDTINPVYATVCAVTTTYHMHHSIVCENQTSWSGYLITAL